jgi:hypothetical protein
VQAVSDFWSLPEKGEICGSSSGATRETVQVVAHVPTYALVVVLACSFQCALPRCIPQIKNPHGWLFFVVGTRM